MSPLSHFLAPETRCPAPTAKAERSGIEPFPANLQEGSKTVRIAGGIQHIDHYNSINSHL